LRNVFGEINQSKIYAGLISKLIYNLPVLSGVYWTTQVGKEKEALASWVVAALLFPINTNKVRNQLSISTISEAGTVLTSGYRGVVPFIALNILLGWSLRPLFSE
jgi:hypothetical protein